MKFLKIIISLLLKKIGLILLSEKKYQYLSRSQPYLRTLDLIQKHIQNKNKIIFEVGGGIGERVEFLSRFLKGNNKFYIFEPNNNLFENLKKKFNNKDRFKIYNFGFLNANKKAKLYVTEDPLLTSNYKILFKKFKTKIFQFYKMKKFINDNKINNIDCLLLNTQGSELEILQSMEEKIKKTKLIFIEVDLVQRYELKNNNNNHLFNIQSFLNKNSFSLADITLIKNENSISKIKMLELAFLKN